MSFYVVVNRLFRICKLQFHQLDVVTNWKHKWSIYRLY